MPKAIALILYLLIAPFFALPDSDDIEISRKIAAQYPIHELVDLTIKHTDKEALIAQHKRFFESKLEKLESAIQAKANISVDAWERARKEICAYFQKKRAEHKKGFLRYKKSSSYKAIDRRITRIIEATLTEFGIDYREIQIICGSDAIAEVMAGSTIKIDLEYFQAIPDAEIRAIIAHEVQHIIFDDCWIIHFKKLEDYIGNAERRLKTPTEIDRLYNMHARIHEARADVFASLKSLNDALKFRSFLIIDMSDPEDVDHPTDPQRLKINRAIIQQLLNIPEERKRLNKKQVAEAMNQIERFIIPKRLWRGLLCEYYSKE